MFIRRWTLYVAIAVAFAPPANARTWNVFNDGSGDAPTIQAAVDSTAPGDTVLVGPGTYVEGVHATHTISLIGTGGASVTTVDRNGEPGSCISLNAPGGVSGCLIEGFRLVGTIWDDLGGNGWYGVSAGGGTTFRDCEFETMYGASVIGFTSFLACTFRRSSGIRFYPYGDLRIEDCLFEENVVQDLGSIVQIDCLNGGCPDSDVLVLNSTFRANETWTLPVVTYTCPLVPGGLRLTVEGCLFEGNTGRAVGHSFQGVSRGCGDPDYAVVDIRNNTIARTIGPALGDSLGFLSESFPLPETVTLHANVLTGNGGGVILRNGGLGADVTCNLVWGNGVDWIGAPDPTGTNGNLSEPPKYCDADGGNYMVAANSPLLPANNGCGVLIGAFGEGCGAVAVEASSWGRIKGLYRE